MLSFYRYRVKSLGGLLNKQARAVNVVWNYCNERQKDALRFHRPWLTGFDLDKLSAGSSKELGLHSSTINAVCHQYATSRIQKRMPYLRWRSNAKSLAWVPIKGASIKETLDGFRFHGHDYRVFKSRDLPAGSTIRDGTNFSRDRRGNWFLNVCVEIAEAPLRESKRSVGIDLGLKTFAVLSTGEKVDARRHYRDAEKDIATAQRARKVHRVKAIHARTANRRSDFQHKLSNRIVREFDFIAVGNVSAANLAKTTMAKSVHDASWSSFRKQLAYKAVRHGVTFKEVNEAWSTQTCNACGVIAGPKGRAGLNERTWICMCGTEHDRDQNAAQNILLRGLGHQAPVEGTEAHSWAAGMSMAVVSLTSAEAA